MIYCTATRKLSRGVSEQLGRMEASKKPPMDISIVMYPPRIEKGSSGSVRPMVSHRAKLETGGKERKARSVNRRIKQQGKRVCSCSRMMI